MIVNIASDGRGFEVDDVITIVGQLGGSSTAMTPT